MIYNLLIDNDSQIMTAALNVKCYKTQGSILCFFIKIMPLFFYMCVMGPPDIESVQGPEFGATLMPHVSRVKPYYVSVGWAEIHDSYCRGYNYTLLWF